MHSIELDDSISQINYDQDIVRLFIILSCDCLEIFEPIAEALN